MDVVVKTSGEKSKRKIAIILNIDKKMALEDIARSQGVSYQELMEELEQMVTMGTSLDLHYCIDEIIEEEYQEEIFEYFKNQMCDNCRHPKPKTDVSNEVVTALKALDTLKAEMEINHLVNYIIGKKSDSVKDHGHDQFPMFGVGSAHDKVFWKGVIRICLLNGYINKNIEKYGLLSVTEVGHQAIAHPKKFEMALDTEFRP